jgi:hypothetical protein
MPNVCRKTKKVRLKITLFTILSILLSFNNFCIGEKIPEKTVQLKYLFSFEELEPKVNCNFISLSHPIAVDAKENVYYCESSNHRIFKFSIDGKFIKEIGPSGNEKSSLRFPSSIKIKDNLLYILDDSGKLVKQYDQEGNFLKSFPTSDKKDLVADSIAVSDSSIFCDLRYASKQWNQHKLITEFSIEGIKKNTFGRIVQSKRYLSYRLVNRSYLAVHNKNIYGAFFAYPAIFCYDGKGKERLFRSLSVDRGDNELDSIFGIEIDYDDNDDGNPRKTRFQIYIWGFAVEKNGNFLLGLNSFSYRRGFVLRLSQAGEPLEKIRFAGNCKEIFPVLKILITDNGKTYIAGKISGNGLSFFEWENKNTK